MLKKLRELFRRLSTPTAESATQETDREASFGRAEASAWLAAMESGKLTIPGNVHDSEAWDRYWSAQLEHGGGIEQGFNDMMASDPKFIPALERQAVRTILCVGNGLSSEPFALALHGFDVTALDLSKISRAFVAGIVGNAENPLHRVPGFTVRGEAAFAFVGNGPIDPDLCPQMHRSEGHLPKGGGSLEGVTGDLMNADICPGPFDVVIERRTVQLFTAEERPAALDRLAARLGPRGWFVSHQHIGAWRPPEPRVHFAKEWAENHGFVLHTAPMADSAPRVARLFFSTG